MPLPVFPAPTAEEPLVTADGLKLHVERFEPAGPSRGVLVGVHGFSSHCGLYRHVAAALARAGVATTLFDCRGHGRSDGRRGYVQRFARFVQDLAAVTDRARSAHPGVPVALFGHSHGAVVVLRYLQDGARQIDAAVLATPWIGLRVKVPLFKRVLSPIMGTLWPTLTMGNELDARNACRDSTVVAEFETDGLVHHVATPRWFNEVRLAQREILAGASTFTVPTLMLVAGQDKVVDTETALALARAVNQARTGTVEVRRYDELFHEVFLEPEGDRVIGDLVTWIGNRWPL